jgi:hypothetical protein
LKILNVHSSQDGTFSFNYKVTDDMGCSDESTITIVVKPTPSADAGANDGVCSLQYALQANSAAPALGEWSMVSGESEAVLMMKPTPTLRLLYPNLAHTLFFGRLT